MLPISPISYRGLFEMRELGRFMAVLQLMTILPLRPSELQSPDWLMRAAKYFPAAGAIVGLLSALVFFLASIVWSNALPALLAVATSILLTGALHEDGLSDTADGLGGGRSAEARLAIMKDSSIGAYGALAMGFSVAIRVTALAALPPLSGACALVAMHAAARAMPIAMFRTLPYARSHSTKFDYRGEMPDGLELVVALAIVVLALLPLAFWSMTAVIAGLAIGSLLAIILCGMARRLINGYTGDVLGGVEQVFEIGFLLGVAALLA
jgi:adenosylcobinamide-GDP ribazoletransferase